MQGANNMVIDIYVYKIKPETVIVTLFCFKINKMDKPLAKLIKKNGEET